MANWMAIKRIDVLMDYLHAKRWACQAAVYGHGVAIGRSICVNRLLHFGW